MDKRMPTAEDQVTPDPVNVDLVPAYEYGMYSLPHSMDRVSYNYCSVCSGRGMVNKRDDPVSRKKSLRCPKCDGRGYFEIIQEIPDKADEGLGMAEIYEYSDAKHQRETVFPAKLKARREMAVVLVFIAILVAGYVTQHILHWQ